MLIHHDRLNRYLKEALEDTAWLDNELGGRERSPFNPAQQREDLTHFQPEHQSANLTIIDCIQDNEEFAATYLALSNFLAYKLTSEVNASYPTNHLSKIGIELKKYPGIRFQKSRLINFESDLEGHDQSFLDFLEANGVERAPVIICGFSAFSFAFMSLAHR